MSYPLNLMDPAHSHAYDLLVKACLDGVLTGRRNPTMGTRDALWLLREKGLLRRNGEKGRKKGWVPTDEGWGCSGVVRPEAAKQRM